MAICHNVIYDERKNKYNASSPDELALVNGAKHLNVVFERKDENNIIYIKKKNRNVKYKLLNVLEFTSSRKRMSVIV
jgi:phospholipid-transporting ATPase